MCPFDLRPRWTALAEWLDAVERGDIEPDPEVLERLRKALRLE